METVILNVLFVHCLRSLAEVIS